MRKDLISFGDISHGATRRSQYSHLQQSQFTMAKKGSAKWVFLVPLVPGSFYMFVISSFILSAKIGFGLSMNVAYIIAAILTAVYAVGVYMLGRKYAAKHTEE